MRDLHDEEEEDDDEGKAEGCYAEVRQAGLLIYESRYLPVLYCLCCAVVYQFSPKVDKVCRHTARNFENEEKEKGKVWRLNHII
jgi:hypothetical protein